MWRVRYQGLDRGIERARAKLGDGPYLVLVHARSLDIEGMTDAIELVSAHSDIAEARIATANAFVRTCQQVPDDPSWHDEPPNIDVAIDAKLGIRLVEQRGFKRKDGSGFHAETRIVQLLEADAPPVIGEPLFRALHYADELALHLARYR
ncbi:MAG: hypothetical protein M4D80_18915 [Myxococcota bacterium]|nr:hypothetical protein [Deltaproteobacteria bacterium]MDQ3337240.1 hypothetical protein [Myxococcota bacterium]